MAATATKLLHDPGWLVAMGAAGCDRAKVRYSWQRAAQDTERTYLRCPGLPPTTAAEPSLG